MPVHVHELPFTDKHYRLPDLGPDVEVLPYEPVVWVSVTRPEVTALPPGARRFPAVLDTGNALALNIREEHLLAWAGLRREELEDAGEVRVVYASGAPHTLMRKRVRLWLHPFNADAADPLDLQTARGIAVYEPGKGPPGPHLPLLGAQGLCPNDLLASIDYGRLVVSLSSP